MRGIGLLIAGLVLMMPVYAQTTYGRMDFSLQNAQGQAISGAQVRVYTQSACGGNRGAPAQLYSDALGATPISQPVITDGFGHGFAYVAIGCVTVTYQSNSTGLLTYPDQNAQNGGTNANISNQASGVIPLGTAPSSISAQSHIDDGVTTAGVITANRPFAAPTGTFNSTGTTTPVTSSTGDSVAKNAISFRSVYNYDTCSNEVYNNWSSAFAQTGWTGTSHFCKAMDMYWRAPGLNFGTTDGANGEHGPGGWSIQQGPTYTSFVNSPGISEIIAGGQYKSGVGDNVGLYMYNFNYGGWLVGSDEGNHVAGLLGGEPNSFYTGNITVGGAKAQTLKVHCQSDCTQPGPGDGRYLISTSEVQSCNATSMVQQDNNTQIPGWFVLDCTVPVSTFWGKLTADVKTPSTPGGGTLGVTPTSITMTVASATINGIANPGAPSTTSLMCFSGPMPDYHEQAYPTSVSGTGPWTVTIPLRHAHLQNVWVFQGGTCGKYVDFAANDTSNSNFQHFPFDITGSIDTHTVVYWFPGTQTQANPLSGTLVRFADTGLTATYDGALITLTNAFASSFPYLIGRTIYLSNASDASFNGACTTPTTSAAGFVQCTPAGTPGASATGITVSVSATSNYGNTALTLQCGAETLDVLDYTTNPPSVSPGSITTLTLEPNTCTWPVSGGAVNVSQFHHASLKANVLHGAVTFYNPMAQTNSVMDITAAGWVSGRSAIPGSVDTSYMLQMNNTGFPIIYNFHGGAMVPPGGIKLRGIVQSGLAMEYAPDDGPGQSAIYIGCPYGGCTTPGFYYNIFSMAQNGGASALRFYPSTSSASWLIPRTDYNYTISERVVIGGRTNGENAEFYFQSFDSGGTKHQWLLQGDLINCAAGLSCTLTMPIKSGKLALDNVFVASGASHATGLVPDPGVTAGAIKFLREDATWQVPSNVQPAEFDNGTCTTAKTITPVNGTEQLVTLTNAQTCALTFTAPVSGTTTISLSIKQSTAGSFNGLISTSGVFWPSGSIPVITATTGAEDFIVCKYRTISPAGYRCVATQDFR